MSFHAFQVPLLYIVITQDPQHCSVRNGLRLGTADFTESYSKCAMFWRTFEFVFSDFSSNSKFQDRKYRPAMTDYKLYIRQTPD